MTSPKRKISIQILPLVSALSALISLVLIALRAFHVWNSVVIDYTLCLSLILQSFAMRDKNKGGSRVILACAVFFLLITTLDLILV